MGGWTAALFTYLLTILISAFCAGMIYLMVVLLEKRSKHKN